ncbi:probable E3 ubiquitin-protein ligase BAH1-like [Glycine soja]|uniref:probable E3 ubiquitin-protein ligase BAH1-like n=1 Tax=Glycine soja TaxID=3848 RepID=UPI001040243D|nr:probable E3 ubiquitin-protein ligase BAH1-like [Glycine soja]
MNAIAMREILQKYDKVHSSLNGKNFKSRMNAEHIDLLHSPWLIELGAFYLNSSGLDNCELDGVYGFFSCDLSITKAVMTLVLPDSINLEYDLTCAICLDFVFNPYALSCGPIFCKSCACSAASVMIFQGLKSASPESKCPICKEATVYSQSRSFAIGVGVVNSFGYRKDRNGQWLKKDALSPQDERTPSPPPQRDDSALMTDVLSKLWGLRTYVGERFDSLDNRFAGMDIRLTQLEEDLHDGTPLGQSSLDSSSVLA